MDPNLTTDSSHSSLYRRLTRLRVQAPLLALLLVLVHQVFEHTLIADLPRWQHFSTQLLFYGIVGPVLAWLALTSLRKSVGRTEEAERQVQRAHEDLSKANRRLRFLIEVNHRLASAQDDEMLFATIMRLPGKVIPVVGCTLMRFDARGQPLQAMHAGDLDPNEFEAWANHLSSSHVRKTCGCANPNSSERCERMAAGADPVVQRAVTLPLERGARDHGVLIVYLRDRHRPTAEEHELLETMANEITLAIESQRLRSRELEAIYRLQQVRRLNDLHADLATILTGTVEALEVTGGVLLLRDPVNSQLEIVAEAGRTLDGALAFVTGVMRGVAAAEGAVVIKDLELVKPKSGPRSLLLAPFGPDRDSSNGVLLLWADEPETFNRRHIRLAEMVAGQEALLVENHRLYSQVEHQAALEERARLAREIHDGLAQVLGYLKLRANQLLMQSKETGMAPVEAGLQEMVELIGDAYTDAREAIDGLRILPGKGGLGALQRQVLDDFGELSRIQIEAEPPPLLSLSPEVESQLLRMLQEGLGNVRKHSQATSVRLAWEHDNQWLTLRITDDGCGFAPEDVPPISRHGLQAMRERSESLGGEFQVVSRPGEGTQLVFRLPSGAARPMVQDE